MGLRWDSPVGTPAERDSDDVWPGHWVDATGFGTYYTATGRGAYHTGVDLNLNKPAWDSDRGAPVYAAADGRVVVATANSPWGDENGMVVILHEMPGGRFVWSRYAHVERIAVAAGEIVRRGAQIAQIGNGGGRYPYHLHFDISTADLGIKPGDWPGLDLARLKRDYVDPRVWIAEHHQVDDGAGGDPGGDPGDQLVAPVPVPADPTAGAYRVTAAAGLRVRLAPSAAGGILGTLPGGAPVTVLAILDGWARLQLGAGGAQLKPSAVAAGASGFGYAQASYLAPIDGDPNIPPAPAAITFEAVPAEIVAGQTVTLTWNAPGATSATLAGVTEAGSPVAPNASTTRQPTATTTYTLVALYPAGQTQSKTVSVTVRLAAPPPVAESKPLVSLNVLGGGQRAAEAMQAGAGGVFISFNPGHARELKRAYPNALLVARPLIESVTTINNWKARIELDSLPAGIVVTSMNENQGFGDHDRKALLDRAQWDEACLRECQKRGIEYAGGSFAFGNPNLADAGIMEIMSTNYARLVREGMWWNQHSYVGKDGSGQGGPGVPLAERFTRTYTVTMPDFRGMPITFNMRQSWWTCERVRFYPMLCGWDPRHCRFLFAECGLEGTVEMVDAPNSGGFAANPQVDFIHYMRDFQYWMGQPFEFGLDRKMYPSPVKGMFVFCANGGAKWAGYEVGHRIPEMKAEFWR